MQLGSSQACYQTINMLSFSLDGSQVIAASYDATAAVIDVASNSLVCSLHGHTEHVLSGIYINHDTVVTGGGADKVLKVRLV